MTTPPQDDSPTVEQLLLLQQQVATLLQGLIDGQKGLTDSLAELSGRQDNQAKAIDLLADLAQGHSEILGGLTEKLDGLTNDIAMVKGGHAVAAMRQNAALIADDLGCQLIEELPQGVVVGFAKVAADDNQPPGEVDSFRHADMVMYGRGDKGHPCYIAVEASYTVDANDVRRAARNARYLQKYTGIQSHAVVAGVEVLPEAQVRIDQGDAQLYRIHPGDMQPE